VKRRRGKENAPSAEKKSYQGDEETRGGDPLYEKRAACSRPNGQKESVFFWEKKKSHSPSFESGKKENER